MLNRSAFKYRVAIRQEDGSYKRFEVSTIAYRADKIIVEYSYVAVTANSIGTQMTNGYLPLYDDNNEIVMRIWKLNENHINPQFKESTYV